MGVKVRITRAQLVALGACAAGLAFFDSLVPSGVFEAGTAAQVETAVNQVLAENAEWANWLGPLGNGYGYGYGYGYDDGDGYGTSS